MGNVEGKFLVTGGTSTVGRPVVDRLRNAGRELSLGAPAGLVPDIAGPRVYAMSELIRGYLRPFGKHRLLVPVWLPCEAGSALRAGANLAPERAVGRHTWEDLLRLRLNAQMGPAALRTAAGLAPHDQGVQANA
jgi:hypothetical protein